MSNVTKKTLREECKTEEGSLSCPFCGRLYENEDLFFEHIEIDHSYQIAEEREKLSVIATENKTALEEWKERKKIEILQNASQTELELYNHDEMALEGRIKDEMWKMAFRQQTRLSSLDTKLMDSLRPENGKCGEGYALVQTENGSMCIPSHLLNEVFQKRVSKEGVEQFKSHPESGMTNQFLPMPESKEAQKVLERSSEELSDSEKKTKRELLTILIALRRDQKDREKALK
jgi:uncharacterized C2H2 Zn-finger protein